MEQNIVHPFMGGVIEESQARTFMGQDRVTGAPQEVSLPNRIVVTMGRKSAVLNGDMVKALVSLYTGKDEFSKGFRQWCEQCK